MRETASFSTDQLQMVNRRRRWFPGRLAVWISNLRIDDIWPFCHIWEPPIRRGK